MTIVQAYRRTKPYTHTFPWVTLHFKPNPAGHVVCDVAFQETVDALLATPSGFRLYDEAGKPPETPQDETLSIALAVAGNFAIDRAAAALPDAPVPPPVVAEAPTTPQGSPRPENAPVPPPPAPPSRYLLEDGDTRVDLAAMDDEELHVFAKANGVQVHHKSKGDTIRDKLVEHFKSEA